MKVLFAANKCARGAFGSIGKLLDPQFSGAQRLDEVFKMSKAEIAKRNTRYNGRVKKRPWEHNKREDDSAKQARPDDEPFVRIKKRKVAMLLGYSGADYFGMQRNPGIATIEGDLHKALLDANYITQEGYDQVQTMNFQRAARTDKGVSAARQIVSLKLPDEVEISKVNGLLPPVIRVFGIKRVTKGFDAKVKCDARTYTYMLPTFSFEKQDATIENHKEYRVPPETVARVNEILKTFLGTHNFHNFTSKKHYIDPSSKRFIINFECGEPFVSDGMEFAIIKIKGQSFMLHQIRKMVGLTLGIVRGLCADDIVDKIFGPERYDVPMAPGLGLMLDQVHYDRYDERYGKDGVHEPLTWKEFDSEVNAFMEKFIFPSIVNTEIGEMPMAGWLETLPNHSFDIRTEESSKIEEDEDEMDSDAEEGAPAEIDEDVKVEKKIN